MLSPVQITENLKTLPLINNLYEVWSDYNKLPLASYDDTIYDGVVDFVKILNYDLDDVELHYAISCIYAVKGTPKVLTYLKTFFGVEVSYTYNILNLGINITLVTTTNPNTLDEKFRIYLSWLLLYFDLSIIYNKVVFLINANLNASYNRVSCITYRDFTVPAKPEQIGQIYGGGYIVNLNEIDKIAYVISLTDLGTAQWWNGSPLVTGATSFNNGQYNTNLIVNAQGPGSYAAIIAKNHTGGGANDWYLPSFQEFDNLIYGAGNSTMNILNANGAQIGGDYWTSNESHLSFLGDPATWAIAVSGYQSGGWSLKSNTIKVRALRKVFY